MGSKEREIRKKMCADCILLNYCTRTAININDGVCWADETEYTKEELLYRFRSANISTISYRLKPCPFCGNEANLIEHVHKLSYRVGCLRCNIMTEFDTSPEYSVYLWNRRELK